MGTRRSRRSWADTVHLGQRMPAPSNGPLAVPELGACDFSGRAWQLWAARYSKRERPGHWAASHCLGCLERAASKAADSTASEPLGLSPTRPQ